MLPKEVNNGMVKYFSAIIALTHKTVLIKDSIHYHSRT
jgi:hypothetical protein